MIFKHLLLSILFICNVCLVTMADANDHVCDKACEVQSSQSESQRDPASTNDCEDQHCCHQNHFHHYLLSFSTGLQVFESPLFNSSFPEPHCFLSSELKEIVKPPLV